MDLDFEDRIYKDIDTTVKLAVPPAPAFDPYFPVSDPSPVQTRFDPIGRPNFTSAPGGEK